MYSIDIHNYLSLIPYYWGYDLCHEVSHRKVHPLKTGILLYGIVYVNIF